MRVTTPWLDTLSMPIRSSTELREQMPVARSEAQSAFGNDEIYLEKLVERA